MTWRELLVFLLIASAPTTGCRTQTAEHPVGVDDEADRDGLDPPKPGQLAETDNAAAAEATATDDEISVEEKLAIDAMQSHLSHAPADTQHAGDAAGAASDAPQQPGALQFAVVQQGPTQPWVMGIVNRGDHNAKLIADPRLLSFEVSVPGKKKPVTCELPAPLRPTKAHARYGVWLEPGQGVVKVFDPRLYCFASSGQQVLVPGAIVTPKFGWAEKVKTVWKGGKKLELPTPQSEPFIARIHMPDDAPAASGAAPGAGPASANTARAPNSAAAPHHAPPPDSAESAPQAGQAGDLPESEAAGSVGVKGLRAPAIALNSEYQAWSAAALPRPAKTESPIVIDMQQGSDAASDLYATVDIVLKNKSRQTQYVYFRRELLNLEVMGPGGAASCDPEPDTRAPDRQAFLVLAPGQRMNIPSRLVELCPKDTFARPGFYLVHARFEAVETGEEFGMEAYVGRVATEHPANVRIRSGELSAFELEAMRPIQLLE